MAIYEIIVEAIVILINGKNLIVNMLKKTILLIAIFLELKSILLFQKRKKIISAKLPMLIIIIRSIMLLYA